MIAKPNHQNIEFFFDPVSPYAWLATTQLERIINRTRREVIVKPILFAGLLNAHGHVGPAEIPAKRDYIFRDVMRRANDYGLEVKGPPNHPFNPLLALRICIAIEDSSQRFKFSCVLIDAVWSKGVDITDKVTVANLASQCGIDSGWALASSQDPLVKKKLMDETQAAVELGIFGVPTFRIDNQNFWGDDRIDDLIRYNQGQRIDEDRLADILSRTPAAKRR